MPEKVTSQTCKETIAAWVREHPGHVASQFVPEDQPVDETMAQNPKNWKRIAKRYADRFEKASYPSAVWIREFECRGYGDGDELRAIVVDDGVRVISVTVQGE